MLKAEELIITDLKKKGDGKSPLSPVRSIIEVYTKSGELLAIHDNNGNFSIEEMIDFAKFCSKKNNSSFEELFSQWCD